MNFLGVTFFLLNLVLDFVLQVINVEQILHLATKDEGYGDKNACVDVVVDKQALEKNDKLQFLLL
jgi:hypothetical protein